VASLKAKRGARPESGAKRAAIYCRVSSAIQAEDDKISLSEQLGDCERYAAERGYEVVARFQDVKSGATSKRPDFQKMLDAAGQGAFEVIVTWKVDRISRELFAMARLLEVIEPAGIGLEAVKEQIDQRYLGLLASVGKLELDSIRERTMAARRAYARKGRITGGGVRYGYRLDENQAPQIHPDEAPFLLEAAHRYASGEPLVAICDDFRRRRVPTRAPKQLRHGATWPPPYLTKLLGDEAYLTGRRTFGGEAIQYPPIYTAELWQAVARRRQINYRHARRNTKVDYLLQKVLWCRCCELSFSCRVKRYVYGKPTKASAVGKRYDLAQPKRSYACVGMLQYGMSHACRPLLELNANETEQAVWDTLCATLNHPETLILGVRSRLVALEATEATEGGEADRDLARLKVERLELIRQRARGKMDDATFDLLVGELDAQETYLQERQQSDQHLRADLEAQRRALLSATHYLDGLRQHVGRRLDELTFTERRDLLLALVDRVWVDGENRLTIEGVLGHSPGGHDVVDCSTALSSAIM